MERRRVKLWKMIRKCNGKVESSGGGNERKVRGSVTVGVD